MIATAKARGFHYPQNPKLFLKLPFSNTFPNQRPLTLDNFQLT